jgi:uncharacterized protein (DUF2267 family)
MSNDDFIDAIRAQLPPHERADAVQIALTICTALGPHLAAMEARALARGLPEGPAAALQREDYVAGLDRHDLDTRVKGGLGVSEGRAHELASIVGAAIADRMDEEAEQHLADAEPSIRALFSRHAGGAPEHPKAGAKGTLAEGRGGGKPPLSEGKPGGRRPLADAHPDRGQPDSIARSDDPRADRRLSSAEPDHTLARGEPPDPTPED